MYVRLIQVINNVNGQFAPVTPMRGAVLVFIADLMQRWTSDRYKSVVSLKNDTDLDPLIKNITTIRARLIIFSKIQLVVYYQSCVLIGRATTRLYVIAHY